MKVIITDGGRSKYFQGHSPGDCVTRAIAIVTGLDYKVVYDELNKTVKSQRTKYKGSSRNGHYKETYDKYLKSLGYTWVPTMKIGSGCKVHLKEEELPKGKIICRCSKHLVAVIDGVIHDTFDPSRDGTRCVYGYYKLN